jgi:hypothetical protein
MQLPPGKTATATCTKGPVIINTPFALQSLPLQVKLNRGLDLVQLDDLLVDLKLTPEVLEVPVPRCFIEDRAQVQMCDGGGSGGSSSSIINKGAI